MQQYDVVVAGAGHNSLITAAYLANAGLHVLVLEANERIGGDTMTEELTLPGFRHDSCSSAHVLIQSNPLIRNDELRLADHGLSYLYPEVATIVPFPDGRAVVMYRDIDRTVQSFAEFSPRDAQTYRHMMGEWKEVAPFLSRVRHSVPTKPDDLYDAMADHPRRDYWLKVRASSALDVICDRFEDDHIRGFMLWMAMMTWQPADQPYTGLLAYSLAAGRQMWSWTTPEGGSGALPEALARIIQARGGEIRASSPVERILIEDGRAVGVITESAEELRAGRGVVSTIHITQLIDAVGRDRLPEQYVADVERWKPGMTMFVVHMAVSEAPKYTTQHGLLSAVAMGTVTSVDNVLAQLADHRRGKLHTQDPVLLAVCSSLVDPTRAPAGHHTLKVIGMQPYQLAEGPERWDEIEQDTADAVVAHFRTYAPNLTPDKILARHVESPLDLERRNRHNHRGSCHGGEAGPSQEGYFRPVPGWAGHRTPIQGLYQTGSTTHPGASVSGGPGRNCAQVFLQDIGLSLQDAIRS